MKESAFKKNLSQSLSEKMSWLRALSRGCRRWRWCCELAERAFETGGGAGWAAAAAALPVLLSGGNAFCRERVPVLVARALEVL